MERTSFPSAAARRLRTTTVARMMVARRTWDAVVRAAAATRSVGAPTRQLLLLVQSWMGRRTGRVGAAATRPPLRPRTMQHLMRAPSREARSEEAE